MNTHWASDTTLGLSVALSYSILATCELDPSLAVLQEGGSAADPILEVRVQTPSAWCESPSLFVMCSTVPASNTGVCLDLSMAGGVGKRSGRGTC